METPQTIFGFPVVSVEDHKHKLLDKAIVALVRLSVEMPDGAHCWCKDWFVADRDGHMKGCEIAQSVLTAFGASDIERACREYGRIP